MVKFKHFILLAYCIALSYGAIWETEDAFIIDDLPEDGIEAGVTPTEGPAESDADVCTDAAGRQGRCIPAQECNPYYSYFQESGISIQDGFERYLNRSSHETCVPSSTSRDDADADATTTVSPTEYVCCTSIKYNKNLRRISFKEYLEMDPGSNETLPEIPPASSESADPTPIKIVTGQRANVGEFPFVVAIISNGRQVCGGSLIAPNFAISAAHCFDRFTPSAVRGLVLKVGDHDLSTGGESASQDVAVQKLFLHPGFFRQQGYFRDDVALLKLRTPVSLAGNVRTITLHSGTPDVHSSPTLATVAGWGKTCGSCGTSTVLMKTKVPIVANQACSDRYRGTAAPPITKNMVCAGGNGGDACNGDSGGPLVIYSGSQTLQIGIVSWGIGCGQYPGVYTRVSNFRGWITKHMQKG